MPTFESWKSASRAITHGIHSNSYILFKAFLKTYLSTFFSTVPSFLLYPIHYTLRHTGLNILGIFSHLYDPNIKFYFSVSKLNEKPSPLAKLLYPLPTELLTSLLAEGTHQIICFCMCLTQLVCESLEFPVSSTSLQGTVTKSSSITAYRTELNVNSANQDIGLTVRYHFASSSTVNYRHTNQKDSPKDMKLASISQMLEKHWILKAVYFTKYQKAEV